MRAFLARLWCILRNNGHHKEFVRSEARVRCMFGCGWESPGLPDDTPEPWTEERAIKQQFKERRRSCA